MKTLKLLLGVLITSVVLLFSSCDCGNKNTNCDSSSTENTETVGAEGNLDADSDHSAENSLDWEGRYLGMLPCASCEGIDAELVIKFDNTYVYTTKYLGGSDEQTIVSEGKITWTNGSIIELHTDSQNVFFQVGENYVELRDVEGNKIVSDLNYRLEKAEDK